jgi:hypothetical protein
MSDFVSRHLTEIFAQPLFFIQEISVLKNSVLFHTFQNTALESAYYLTISYSTGLVLVEIAAVKVYRWDDFPWHDVHTKFREN